MKRFIELRIDLNGNNPQDFVDALFKQGNDEWVRAEQKGVNLLLSSTVFFFELKQSTNLPGAVLGLMEETPSKLWVSNIVPTTKNRLSVNEYNSILTDFTEKVIEPVAIQLGATFEITEADYELENLVSPETAQKLRNFSSLANKGTGIAHPRDRDRWFAFIDSVHKDSRKISRSDLERFLIEEGWMEDQADMLADEFVNATDLLEYTNQH